MKYIAALLALIMSIYYLYQVKRKSTRVVWLIYFEIIYNMIIKFMIGNLGLPLILNYFSDFILIWIIIEFLVQKGKKGLVIPKSLIIGFLILIFISVISFIYNLYSPFLYIWGFRNNFRFLLFAMMCAVYLDHDDIKTIIEILFGYFLLNILIVTYQFFFISYTDFAIGDFISGLFSNGAERGGNASLNWLMSIVCTYAIVQYLNKEAKIQKFIICLTGSLYMAALAEIKLFFVQIIIIGILAMIICKKSFKSFGFLILGICMLGISIKLFYYLFPDFANFFKKDRILAYVLEGGYSSGKTRDIGINRFTAITYVFKHYLQSNIDKLIGIGLGNADFSSFSFLTSYFYTKNNWSGYTFFYSAFITIELGIIGLISYILIILNYLRKAITVKINSYEDKSIKQSTIIISIICLAAIFSNQTMKLEASAYLVHCVLAFPFILEKQNVGYSGTNSKIKKIHIKA